MLDDSNGKLDDQSLQRIIRVWRIKSLGSNVAGKLCRVARVQILS